MIERLSTWRMDTTVSDEISKRPRGRPKGACGPNKKKKAMSLVRQFFFPEKSWQIDSHAREMRRILIKSELANRKDAREKFACFVKFIKPDFFMAPFHAKICNEIDMMIRENHFLTLSCPPRFGKSELTSRLLPAFLLGQNSKNNIVLASYSQSLASKNMRDCLRIMSDPKYKLLFPNTILPTKLDKNYLNRQDFTELVCFIDGFQKWGSIKSVGVGASLTGFGASYLILDDLHKDREEANSSIMREKCIDWYNAVARTRLDDQHGKIVIIGTRFHTGDIIGTVTENKTGDQWKSIVMPAIAEVDDEFRKVGESLWHDKFPPDELNKIKESIGIQEFSCLYQQNPLSQGNTAFSFTPQFTDFNLQADLRQGCVISIDPSLGNSKSSDYSSITIAQRCIKTKKIYIDSWHERLKSNELIEKIVYLVGLYKPDSVVMEKNGFQSLLLNPLNDALLKRGLYTKLSGINNSVEKRTRILRLQQFIPHMIFVQNKMNQILTDNIKCYPVVSYDDPCDSLEMAMRALVEICNEKVLQYR